MAEKVLFENERRMSRGEIADFLRRVADGLDTSGDVTLRSGEESVSLDVPGQATFEVKVERETSRSGPAELELEFELEWTEGEDEGSLSVE